MTTEEIIHVYENSRLVTEYFTEEAATAAYIEGLAALRAQQEQESPEPLTLDEMREMDQNSPPIWDSCLNEWCAVRWIAAAGCKGVSYIGGGSRPLESGRFYRHKPSV